MSDLAIHVPTHKAPSALVIVLARGGSKGLPNKNGLACAGQPVLSWTLDHAARSRTVARTVLSTDCDAYKQLAAHHGIDTVHRPHKLADDLATVDAAARHAVRAIDPDAQFEHVVILYGNVPVRPGDLTDRAVCKLAQTGCDSVQSLCPVGKMHPYWMKELGGDDADVMIQHVPNRVYRRQDLPPLYMLDGGIIAVRRACLFNIIEGEPHAFLGEDRRAVLTQPGEVVDIDESYDLLVAEARLRAMGLAVEARVTATPPLALRSA